MLNLRRRTPFTFLLTGVVFLVLASPANAQSRVGVRAGISADPDQFYFGGHMDVSEVAKRVWFRPNAEIGLGNHLTTATFNGEFVYRVASRKEWNPYLGGGPGLVVSTFHSGTFRNTDVGPGFNFVAGMEQRKGLLVEVKAGLMDSPSFKLGIGWTW